MTITTQALIVSDINEDDEVLRERFQQWGYLHFKQAADAEVCEQLMQQFLNELDPYLSFDQQTQLPSFGGQAFFETDPIWDEVYPKIQSLESFHQFFHRPEILQLMQRVSNSDVFVYPMKMARISTPKKIGYETPPHQDAHSHQAGPTMAGIWVALHDVDESMGRLQILPESHKSGVRPVFQAEGVGGIQCEIYDHETTWHVSNVSRGDIIIFHSCTVHRAEPNTAKTAARLSIDTRFCDYGAPVFSTNLEPHHGWRIDALSWDSIYQHWQQPTLQYYWRDYPNFF